MAQIVAPGSVVVAASAGVSGSGVAGADAFGLPDGLVPDGARRQRMRFGFRSNGFFAAEPAAHLAIGLTGRWRKDNPSTSGFDGCLEGRGIVIGNVSGAPSGCPRWPVLQIESFRSNGNALFENSGSAILADGHDYRIDLRCGLDGDIEYTLCDALGQTLANARVDDRGAAIAHGLGGWWITHVFSDTQPQRDWSIDFVDLCVDWE